MKLDVTPELRDLCLRITQDGRTPEEWAKIESDDMFQSRNFEGGFDATEKAFCFSYYDLSRSEFWFQLTLDQVIAVSAGTLASIEMRPAE